MFFLTTLVIACTNPSPVIIGTDWPLRNVLSDLGSSWEVGNRQSRARSKKAVSKVSVNAKDLARSLPRTRGIYAPMGLD